MRRSFIRDRDLINILLLGDNVRESHATEASRPKHLGKRPFKTSERH